MNRIARTLFVALPLSAAALTLSTGTATADTPGPVIVMPSEPGDPGPKDIANPTPEGPGDITDTPDLPLDSGEGDDGEEEPDFPLDGGCFEGCDLPEDETTTDDTEVAGITTPNRVDAGVGANDDTGLQLTWLLAGGALVTAGGATLVARKEAQ